MMGCLWNNGGLVYIPQYLGTRHEVMSVNVNVNTCDSQSVYLSIVSYYRLHMCSSPRYRSTLVHPSQYWSHHKRSALGSKPHWSFA